MRGNDEAASKEYCRVHRRMQGLLQSRAAAT